MKKASKDATSANCVSREFVSEAAAALGRQNRGKTKTISQAERLRRRARLAYARKFRWGARPCV